MRRFILRRSSSRAAVRLIYSSGGRQGRRADFEKPRTMRASMKSAENQTNGPRAAQGKKRTRQPPKMRETKVEDYAQIVSLHIRNDLAIRSYEEWVALWRDNPACKQRNGRWPIGWVLETAGGEVVGSIGNIPLAYHFRGHELQAATASSWVVDAPYRGYSMLILDRLMRQEAIDLFICTTVSPRAEPVFSIFQLSRVPVGTWHKSAYWITNYRGFSQSALRTKSVPMARLMSYPVSTALFCWDRLTHAGLAVDGSTSEIELCREFDSRFDDFWEELRHQNHGVLLAVRTRETLAWHFRESLLRGNAWVLTACEGSRLRAYAIFTREDNPAVGLKRVRLVDFQALNGSEAFLRSALKWVLQRCRNEDIHVVDIIGCWLDRPGMPHVGAPHHRTLPSWTYYYKANDKDLSESLRDPAIWAPSSFDGDASL